MDDFRAARVNLVNSAIVVCRLMHSVRLGVDSCFRDVCFVKAICLSMRTAGIASLAIVCVFVA